MRHLKSFLGFLSCLFAVLFVFQASLAAQQAPPPPQNPNDIPPKPAGAAPVPGLSGDSANPDDDANVLPPAAPPNPYTGTIRDAGTGLPLLGTPGSPLRWGDFSISTFQYVGIHDRFDPRGQAIGPWTNLQLFTVGLMFNHYIKKTKSRLVLQYLPQAAYTEGQFRANGAANNTVSLGLQVPISERLSVTFQDSFSNVHSNPLIPQNFLAADGREGALVQNNFLDTAGSFWAETAQATIQYNISPRLIITFTPQYRYAAATNNQANYLANGQSIAGVATLGYALSLHRTIGFTESFQYLTDAGQSSKYETAGVFYSEQLAPALWITGNVGAQRQSFSALPNGDNWGFAGGFSVISNAIRKMPIALAYSRGVAFNNYISLNKEDRIDASVGFLPLRRVSWNNSVGYLREIGGTQDTWAKYATSEINYRFHGNFMLFSTYSYTFANASTPAVLSGNRITLAFGLKWIPPILFGQ